MLALILDSRTALAGAVQGVELCLKTLIPSLFPFLFLSGCFSAAFSGGKQSGLRFFGKLFSLPAGTEYLLVPAFLGGYPVGAQGVSQAYASGCISKNQAEQMLAYCSNVGPAFLFGILSRQFDKSSLVWITWAIQILSAWTAAKFFGCGETQTYQKEGPGDPASFGMEDAVIAMLKICGWVILFRIVQAFLNRWFLWAVVPWARVGILGALELANGCCCLGLISEEGLRFIVCNCMLSFGGLCVAYQTASVCNGLGLRYYFAGKILQAVAAALLAAGIYYRLWVFFPLWLAAVMFAPRAFQKKSRNPAPLGV